MADQECEAAPGAPEMTPHDVEKIEEAKLKAKYGNAMGGPRLMGGHSAFLQKRLAKGQKFFDSGDYQMAKQKVGSNINKSLQLKANCGGGGDDGPVTATFAATGDAIPTPETVPARKTSIIQPSKFTPNVKCRSMSEGCVEYKKKQR